MKNNVFKSYAILAVTTVFLFTGSMANAGPKGKIEICHKPGRDNQTILNISARGLAGHERHGDYLVTPEVCDGLDSDCDNPRVADNDVDCSDGIACTVDSCGGLLGCESTPDDSLCDDQDPTTSDMCNVSIGQCVNTIIQVCGNLVLETPEECDDGNTTSGDGCSAECTIEPFCGDGILDPGEQCDDGNTSPGDGCSSVCTIESFCGNGILEETEQCDDGNAISGDGCSTACEVEASCPCWSAEELNSIDGIHSDGSLLSISTRPAPNNYCEESGDVDGLYNTNHVFAYEDEYGPGTGFCQAGLYNAGTGYARNVHLRYLGDGHPDNRLTLNELNACFAEVQTCVARNTQ